MLMLREYIIQTENLNHFKHSVNNKVEIILYLKIG